jgi:Glycosyl hydrolases family 17
VESIGVCYGLLGDNLPEPSDVISLYRSNGIDAMRLYNPDSNVLNALKGTNISLMVGVPNEVLESFAYNASAAANWVQNNIVAHNGVNFKY